MPRPTLPLVVGSGLLLVALLEGPPPAQATNTDEDYELRVTLFDGTVHQGRVKMRKTTLDIVSPRKAKLRYKDIAQIEDVPPPSPEERARDLEQAAKRRELIKEGDPAGWGRLGKWARDHELEEEARAAYEKALELDPDHAPSRAALGFTKTPQGWVKTEELLQPEAQALAPDDLDGRVALAKRAIKGGADQLGFELLRDVLIRDAWHSEALDAIHPFTARYRQTTRLTLPVRGRWHASEDKTDHHGLKAYAVYALDLMKVDAEEKAWKGDGKQLEEHHCFGQPFYAVAAGKVVSAHDGKPDNRPFDIPASVRNAAKDEMTHNGVAILHENNEVSWYIHAKNGSIKVKVGDEVKAGDLLGEVGNSGRSAIPHLHFTMVNFRGLSVPWACDDYLLIAEDGTPIKVRRACPREGWTISSREE